jgi:hypothetical protein
MVQLCLKLSSIAVFSVLSCAGHSTVFSYD